MNKPEMSCCDRTAISFYGLSEFDCARDRTSRPPRASRLASRPLFKSRTNGKLIVCRKTANGRVPALDGGSGELHSARNTCATAEQSAAAHRETFMQPRYKQQFSCRRPRQRMDTARQSTCCALRTPTRDTSQSIGIIVGWGLIKSWRVAPEPNRRVMDASEGAVSPLKSAWRQ